MFQNIRSWHLMPHIPISCFLPPSRVDPEVQGLKVIIDCPHSQVVLGRPIQASSNQQVD